MAIPVYVPARPDLDGEAVNAGNLYDLENATQITIFDNSGGGGGGGIGCGSAADASPGNFRNNVDVVDRVDIGPLTVVALSASTAADLAAWLEGNHFNIPASSMPVIERYSLPGQYFIAARRNDASATNQPTSIGVHFTLPGEQLGLPLPIAQIGGSEDVSFILFVAAQQEMRPTGPYARLTLEDLDEEELRIEYRGAIDKAVAAKDGRAFVAEGTWDASIARGRLQELIEPGQKITRLTTVTRTSALTENMMLGPERDSPSNNYVNIGQDQEPAEDDGGCRAVNGVASPAIYLLLIFAFARRTKRHLRDGRRS